MWLTLLFLQVLVCQQGLLASATVAAGCRQALSTLAQGASLEIAQSLGAESPERMVPVVAVRVAQAKITDLVREHVTRMQELEDLSEKAKQCRGNRNCLVRVGRPLLSKVNLVRRVIRTTFRTEKQVRRDLAGQTDQMAKEWIDSNFDRQSLSLTTEEIGELQVLISGRLHEAIVGKRFSLPEFMREAGGHFAQAFRALTFRELRHDKVARTDYLRNLFTVLSLQVSAHLLHSVSAFVAGEPVGFADRLWIYGNTASMMTIQAEVGARNQRRTDKPIPIHDFSEAMIELPNILIGDRGFWRDSQKKMLGFLALLPLEYAVTVAAKAVNVAAGLGPEALLQTNTQLEIALVNLASTAIFGTYLSLRWSLIDKWLYLNLLPSMRASSLERAEEKLRSLKEAHLVPEGWSVKDFYLAAGEANRPWWKWWQRAPKNVHEEVTLRPEVFKKVFLTEDARALLEAYRTSKRAQRFEWAWRYGVCLLDSYIIFGLFGSWVPQLLGF